MEMTFVQIYKILLPPVNALQRLSRVPSGDAGPNGVLATSIRVRLVFPRLPVQWRSDLGSKPNASRKEMERAAL